jgi:hypothetical protein
LAVDSWPCWSSKVPSMSMASSWMGTLQFNVSARVDARRRAACVAAKVDVGEGWVSGTGIWPPLLSAVFAENPACEPSSRGSTRPKDLSEVVDNFRSLAGKAKFFETACLKEPGNPCILQHYARMLLRERQLTLALSQIDAALERSLCYELHNGCAGEWVSCVALEGGCKLRGDGG